MANHPIFAPTFHGDVVAVKKLLEGDAILVAIRDAKNLTPLHVAASRGQAAVAELLIEHGAEIQGAETDGAEVDSASDGREWTPLVFAAYRGHVEVTKVLLANGAGVTVDDGNPIHFAGQRKHQDICRLLVEYGAVDELIDSDDPDVLGLFRAAYSYDSGTVKEILARRPELAGVKDKNGRTALHEACTHGDTKTVRALLKCGADATIRDANGQTPADRAAAHRQHAVTKLLGKHVAEA